MPIRLTNSAWHSARYGSWNRDSDFRCDLRFDRYDASVEFSPVRRIDWATLLKRVHSVDALACPCGGRLKFVDVITEPTTAREVLQTMGLPTDLPPIAKARSPAFYQASFPVDWNQTTD